MYSHFAPGKQKNPVTYGYNSTYHRTIFILINFLMSNLQCVLFYINNIMYKASHLIIFVSFFTHFKWSKPGLNSTFPLWRTAEKSSKIKRSKHFIKSLPVYCRGRRKALVSYFKFLLICVSLPCFAAICRICSCRCDCLNNHKISKTGQNAAS